MNPIETAVIGLVKLIEFFINKSFTADKPIEKIINFNAATQAAMGVVFVIAFSLIALGLADLGHTAYQFINANIQPTQLALGIPAIMVTFGIYLFKRTWKAIGLTIGGMRSNTKRVRVLSTCKTFSTCIGVVKLPNKARTREQKFMALRFSDEDGIECEIVMDYKSAETAGINLLDALYSNRNEIYTQPDGVSKRITVKGDEMLDLKSLWDKHGSPERKIINFTPKKKD